MIWNILAAALMSATPALAEGESPRGATLAASPYAGHQMREIKSLSAADIEELERGGGWGLALAAELNGVPGPAHLLELRHELKLDADQVTRLTAIRHDMRRAAIAEGRRLIAAERDLSEAFASGLPTVEDLGRLTRAVGEARAALQEVHLKAHLETPALLTAEQLRIYVMLRGYGHADRSEPQQHSGHAHTPSND